MKNISKFSAYLAKTSQTLSLDEIRKQTEQRILERDPSKIVRVIHDSGTLIPGVVIVQTANSQAYYATAGSIERLRRDPALHAEMDVNSLTLLDEATMPEFKDRLIPYLTEAVIRFSNAYASSQSTTATGLDFYLDAQIETAALTYQRLRGSEVGHTQASDEFKQALVAIGHIEDAPKPSNNRTNIAPSLG